MTTVWYALGIALAAAIAYLLLVAFGGVGIRVPRAPTARPATTPAESLAKLEELHAKDTEHYAPACSSVVLEPDDAALGTLVVFHGFTNCPNQFTQAAEQMRRAGYRILLPRQPRHGVADVLNRDLAELTTDELTAHVAEVMDIAPGWGDPVYVAGLSGGGVLAYWAAATRPEVARVLGSAPFAAPKGIPMPVVRLLIRFHRVIPKIYWWWDPRKKADLGESPYVYPGFPLPGMVPFLHLAWALESRKVAPGHEVDFAGLTTNPGDFAIRQDQARSLFDREFAQHARQKVEWVIAKNLGWWHDFVDPDGSHHGEPEQVASVYLTGLGLTDRGVQEGLMTAGDARA